MIISFYFLKINIQIEWSTTEAGVSVEFSYDNHFTVLDLKIHFYRRALSTH